MSTGIGEDLVEDRRRAVESLEEAVYSRNRLNVGKAPRELAETLFSRLKDAVKKGSDIGEFLSKGTAAKELGTTVTSTSFKGAVKKVPKALKACRPDSGSLPPDDDQVGVAAIDALIGGVPHLVIVRGPTAEYRPGAPQNDDSLRLKVEFRPTTGEPVAVDKVLAGSGDLESRRTIHATALIGAFVFAAVLVLSMILLWPESAPSKSPSTASPPPPPASRHSTAVMTFRNNTDEVELAWLSTALAEISSQAMSSPRTRVVPREEVVRLEAGLRLHGAAAMSVNNLARVRKRVHADTVVVGTFSRVGGPGPALIEVQVNLLDTRTGASLATDSAIGNETQLVEIVTRVSAPIRERLKIGAVDEDALKASVPSVFAAHRLYAGGLATLRQFHATEARDFLMQAAALEDGHPLINFALSAACDTLGRESEAREAITKARAQWEGLSGQQKLQIEIQYHKHDARSYEFSNERQSAWQRAIDAQRKLCQLAEKRDDIECGLQLATLMIAASKATEALATITTLRRQLPARFASDARLDLVEARAHQEQSQSKQQLSLAMSAATKAQSMGDCVLVGQARMLQSTALLEIPDIPAANAAISDARECFHQIGDAGSDARAIEQKATSVGIGLDLELESQLLHQAFDEYRKLGDQGSMARVTVRMSLRLARAGNALEAQKSLANALAVFKKVGGPYEVAATLNEIGAIRFYRGDLAGAEEYYRQALEIFQTIPNSQGTATALTNIGEVLACRGELAAARKLHTDSFKINSGPAGGQPNKSGVAYDLFMIGEILALQGDRVAARVKYAAALKMQEDENSGEPIAAAETKIAIARSLLQDERLADAESLADAAEQVLRNNGAEDRGFLALATIAQILLAQGRRAEALQRASDAWEGVASSDDLRLRFAVAIARTQTWAASSDDRNIDAALAFLEKARNEAAQTGYVVAELQMRLTMAEIEATAGRATGLDRLAAVERAAKSKGIGEIVRRAAAALRAAQARDT